MLEADVFFIICILSWVMLKGDDGPSEAKRRTLRVLQGPVLRAPKLPPPIMRARVTAASAGAISVAMDPKGVFALLIGICFLRRSSRRENWFLLSD